MEEESWKLEIKFHITHSLAYIPKAKKLENLHSHIHVHISQKLEIIQMSKNRWLFQKCMVFIHNGILLFC